MQALKYKRTTMKKIFSLLMVALLLGTAFDAAAQAKPKKGKKAASPFIEGRQKVRQSDYDSVWQFSNFNTKDLNVYYSPYDYANFPKETRLRRPDWGCLKPVVSYLQKSSRGTMTMCAIYAVNPDIDDLKMREELGLQAREEAKACLDAFEGWMKEEEMRNKVQFQVAEVDYRYFKGPYYFNEKCTDQTIRVGLLMYFGSKKRPIFIADTTTRTFADIKFFPNDATIVESWASHIDTLANYLKDNERKSVLLIGYSDNSGTEAYNKGLSRQRAVEVKKALEMRGIDVNRIDVEARGDSDPIGDNDTREGRIQNNRVSIKIL